MLTGFVGSVGSKAKLSGASIVLPDTDHVDWSSSAMKASLKALPTYSGYSSERKRKSSRRQFAFDGTFRSILKTDTSFAPRTELSSAAPSLPELFAFGARRALPLVRIA